MKALLLKDLFTMRIQLKWISFIVAFFIIMSFFLQDGIILLSLTFLFGTIQVTSLFSFDEKSGWDKFSNTLPFKKSDIIKSKYIFSLLLTAGILLLVVPIVLFSNLFSNTFMLNEILAIICLVIAVSIVTLSFIVPILVKFGTQKGRIVLFAAVFLPIYGANFILNGINHLSPKLPSMETILKLSYVTPIFALIILTLSYMLSVKFYESREF